MPFRVALTFDVEHHDRPATADATETLLDQLTRLELRTTCFIQGRWAEAYPGTAGSIAAAGHLVGNHSYYHARMPLFTDAGLVDDLTDAGRVIRETTGADPRPWFRCPFGEGADDPRVQAAVRASGYRHVGWHVGVEDWDPAKPAEAIEREVVERTLAHGDGAVVPAPRLADRDARGDRRHRRPAARCRGDVRHDRRARRGPEHRHVSPARPPEVAVLAVDGGNSKTDLLLVGPDGRLLASGRGPTSSHQKVGMDAGADRLVEQADAAWTAAGLGSAGQRPPATVGSYALAGADTPADVRRLGAAFDARRLATSTLIVNDFDRPDPRRLRARLGHRDHLRCGRQRGGDRPGRAAGQARRARPHLRRLGRRRGARPGRARGRGPRP